MKAGSGGASKISKQSSLNDRDNNVLIESAPNQKEINYQKLADLVKDQRNIQSLSQFSKNSSYHQGDSENNKYFNIQSKDHNEFPTGLIDQEVEVQPHQETQNILEKCVEGIQPQFKQVLAKHESDFVQAYRGHMQKVQKELLFLKSKANETAGKILNDDSITRLQGQIGWFKNEATKLDAILEGQKRELQKMKNRQSNLKEDRKFLRDQVKDAKKNNKLLEVALKKTEDQNSLLKKFLDNNKVKRPVQTDVDKTMLSPKQIINKTMAQFKEPFITQQVPIDSNEQEEDSNSQDQNFKGKNHIRNLLQMSKLQQQNMQSHDMLSQESQDFKIKEFVLDLFKRGHQKDKVELKIAKFFKLYDLSRDDRIEDLKRQVEMQKKQNLKIRGSCAQDYSEKSEVENLFLDCVDECKKELLKKKSMSHGQQSQAKFQNNVIAENTFQDATNGLMEQVVLNKDSLITTFEEIFGTGGYVGATIGNLEHQIKQKKYSLVGNHNNNSMSYFSNATTKDNQSEEAERVNIIMNAPIENLINNMSEYSFNIGHPYQNTAQNFNPSSNQTNGFRKQSLNSISVTTKRASTAGGGKGSTQAGTALTHYNDLLPPPNLIQNQLITHQQKSNQILNQYQQVNQSNLMANSSNSFMISTNTNQVRAATSQSHQRRLRLDHSNLIAAPGEELQLIDRSRQNQVKPQTQFAGSLSKKTKSQERSFSVRNGKLMMNNTQSSFNK